MNETGSRTPGFCQSRGCGEGPGTRFGPTPGGIGPMTGV